uniref:Uncharacterized protein n=1 Tax=Parascaris equorum TaxID=6256 RepID=A0A914RH48_PAREQ
MSTDGRFTMAVEKDVRLACFTSRLHIDPECACESDVRLSNIADKFEEVIVLCLNCINNQYVITTGQWNKNNHIKMVTVAEGGPQELYYPDEEYIPRGNVQYDPDKLAEVIEQLNKDVDLQRERTRAGFA